MTRRPATNAEEETSPVPPLDPTDEPIRRSTAEVVVSVGTDHHPFDRLIGWIDEWRYHHPDVVVVVQAGTSAPSRHGDSRDLIPHRDLLELFRRAVAVVSHGGPSTVMDARMSGRLPIVVPRNPAFGEHVDEHQVRFAGHLDRHDVAVVVHDRQSLFDAIDQAFADPESFAVAVGSQAAAGVAEFGRAVDSLLQGGVKPEADRSDPAPNSSRAPGEPIPELPTTPSSEPIPELPSQAPAEPSGQSAPPRQSVR